MFIIRYLQNSPKIIHLYLSGYYIDPVYLPESMTTTMKVSRAKTKFKEGQPREPRESASSVGSREELGLPTVASVAGSIMTAIEAKNKFTQTVRNKGSEISEVFFSFLSQQKLLTVYFLT